MFINPRRQAARLTLGDGTVHIVQPRGRLVLDGAPAVVPADALAERDHDCQDCGRDLGDGELVRGRCDTAPFCVSRRPI